MEAIVVVTITVETVILVGETVILVGSPVNVSNSCHHHCWHWKDHQRTLGIHRPQFPNFHPIIPPLLLPNLMPAHHPHNTPHNSMDHPFSTHHLSGRQHTISRETDHLAAARSGKRG
uniref:Uncharacterized protein n=1 Tax=Cacopsylla melanoneura TaxID=428564 RepID=A0A8D8XQ36_9HEMI